MRMADRNRLMSVPKDALGLFLDGVPKERPILRILGFKAADVSSAADVPYGSVRYDNKIPKKLTYALTLWASLINTVAEFFGGDKGKVALWFQLPNPILGGISPRDMIRVGRFARLKKAVESALSENK